MLKINRERRKKMSKIRVLDIKNHRSAAVGEGGGRRVRPPGSASVYKPSKVMVGRVRNSGTHVFKQ